MHVQIMIIINSILKQKSMLYNHSKHIRLLFPLTSPLPDDDITHSFGLFVSHADTFRLFADRIKFLTSSLLASLAVWLAIAYKTGNTTHMK